MEKKLTLIIADDEQFICGMLSRIIEFEMLGIKHVGTAYDGEMLLSMIDELRPDIVVTDIYMPKIDGLEVIRQSKERGYNCRFIIISGYRQFEYAYNALKYEVEDYILKPVEKGELNDILKKVSVHIRQKESGEPDHNDRNAIRAYLVEKAIDEELRKKPLPLEEMNQIYNTHFETGYYRMLNLKLDYSRDVRQINEDAYSVLKKLENLVVKQFDGICFDVLTAIKHDGCIILLNYEAARDNEIKNRIYVLFTEGKNIVDLFQGLNLTICVGTAVKDPGLIYETRRGCRRAKWIRMAYGINKVIFEESVEDQSVDSFLDTLKELEARLEKAFSTLNVEECRTGILEFFTLPLSVLCCTESMMFMRRIIRTFCNINKDILDDSMDTEAMVKQMNTALHLQVTFRGYRDELIVLMTELIERLQKNIKNKNSKPVRQVCAYIERNYGEKINLESMAELVDLNPVYFSNLFKKETGQNFTEYVTDYRMKAAKKLLKDSNKNINEIAYELGYPDARYFSKLFKKNVGVKPTEYRKIYG